MATKVMNHGEYQKKLKKLPYDSLLFIIKDAGEAIKALPENPNNSYYADEICYAGMELAKRRKTHVE